MIGEGLMRVNNTLTAQRLTKSLSYQAGVRKRRGWKLVLSLICLFFMLAMMVIGFFLIWTIFRMGEPIFKTVGPFLQNLINGINTYFYASTEKAMYKPMSKAITVAQLNELQKFMNVWIGNIDFSPVSNGFSALTGGLSDMAGTSINALKSGVGDIVNNVSGLFENLGTGSGSNDFIDAVNNGLNSIEDLTASIANVVGKL